MIRITSNLAARLKHHACVASANAHASAVAGIKKVPPTQHESWHVAHLCRGISRLAASWRKELVKAAPGTSLSLSSVFTHQSPYVRWPNRNLHSHSCELADLLVAVIDRTGNAPVGYAVLIQAKLSTSGSVTLSVAGEKTQFDLLTKRPVFDVRPINSPSQVDLSCYTPDSALMYGMAPQASVIHPGAYPCWHSCWSPTWVVADDLIRYAKPPYTVTAADCLPSVLVGMLQGNFGWQFHLPPTGQDWRYFSTSTPRDYWSELIAYLLKDTFGKPLTKRHGKGAARAIRGQDDVLCLVSSASGSGTMFLLADGLSHSRLQSYFGDDEAIDDEWTQSDFDNFMSGDGGIGEFVFDESADRPSGPISAVVIEIGREG